MKNPLFVAFPVTRTFALVQQIRSAAFVPKSFFRREAPGLPGDNFVLLSFICELSHDRLCFCRRQSSLRGPIGSSFVLAVFASICASDPPWLIQDSHSRTAICTRHRCQLISHRRFAVSPQARGVGTLRLSLAGFCPPERATFNHA